MKYSQFGLLIAVLHLLTAFIVTDDYSTIFLLIMSLVWMVFGIIANFLDIKSTHLQFKIKSLERKNNYLIGSGIIDRLDLLLAIQLKDKKKIQEIFDRWKKESEESKKSKEKESEKKDDKSNN